MHNKSKYITNFTILGQTSTLFKDATQVGVISVCGNVTKPAVDKTNLFTYTSSNILVDDNNQPSREDFSTEAYEELYRCITNPGECILLPCSVTGKLHILVLLVNSLCLSKAYSIRLLNLWDGFCLHCLPDISDHSVLSCRSFSSKSSACPFAFVRDFCPFTLGRDFCPFDFVRDFCPFTFGRDFCPFDFVRDFYPFTFVRDVCPLVVSCRSKIFGPLVSLVVHTVQLIYSKIVFFIQILELLQPCCNNET